MSVRNEVYLKGENGLLWRNRKEIHVRRERRGRSAEIGSEEVRRTEEECETEGHIETR